MNSYPLNYPEGKYKMHKCIAQLIPENNCNTYIEPFCGGETVVVELLFYGDVYKRQALIENWVQALQR